MKQQLEQPQLTKKARILSKTQILTTDLQEDRGLSIGECKTIVTAPIIPIREKTYYRVIYETGLRPIEALSLQIEDLNKLTGEMAARKVKGKRNRFMQETTYKIRYVIVSPRTIELLKTLIGNRKKGSIFITDKGLAFKSIRYMEKQLNKFAGLLSIQKLRRYRVDNGATLPLITLMSLRKAGERHHDAAGGDSSLSAQASGHTMKTKIQYYQNDVKWDEVHNSYKANHPAFNQDW